MGLLIMLGGTIVGVGVLAYSMIRLTEQDALEAALLPFADEPDYKPQMLLAA